VIVPRWEWRTFAEPFGAADARFDALTPERERTSDETYVVTRASEASVKVRDALVDVKLLEKVGPDGLQRWRPVLKAAFPLSAGDVAVLLRALAIDAPPLPRHDYTREQLVEELLRPVPGLVAVRVHKHRAHYTVSGCMAERSEISTEHGTRRTIGIESEDPDLVRAVVHELGLDGRPNVSLPRELQALTEQA
jgi:exopolyphosphatase / guanosine-5'-triphosphate,3'-diphosphate pyrophosphatase